MNELRARELWPNRRRYFSGFMTARGWEVLPPIQCSKPLTVTTTVQRLAPCLVTKPSQLPILGLWKNPARDSVAAGFFDGELDSSGLETTERLRVQLESLCHAGAMIVGIMVGRKAMESTSLFPLSDALFFTESSMVW